MIYEWGILKAQSAACRARWRRFVVGVFGRKAVNLGEKIGCLERFGPLTIKR